MRDITYGAVVCIQVQVMINIIYILKCKWTLRIFVFYKDVLTFIQV